MNLTRRNRRLRSSAAIRALVRENRLSIDDFIVPIFAMEGSGIKKEIPSMPGYYKYSLDTLEDELKFIQSNGFKAVLLFVQVDDELKDNKGTETYNPDGLMQRTIKKVKSMCPDMLVFTDVALDPYSSYGHDGIVEDNKILNDETVEVLAKMALSHAEAGADFVAPSDMMDGRVAMIRSVLDSNGYTDVGIMSYTAKYASSFYGPFRDALDSAPGFGDKKTYQMDFGNSAEAVLEARQDEEEGADILLVKPGIAYLDILQTIKMESELPVAIYQVSGEYAMIKAAAEKGWIEELPIVFESLMAMKRAGADMIITYFAKEIIQLLNKEA